MTNNIKIKVLEALKAVAKEATEKELYTTLITIDSPDGYAPDVDLDLEDLIWEIEKEIEQNA